MSIFEQLAAPFPGHKVSWRVGSKNKDNTSGLALAYIDARDVYERLDTVVGPEGWQCDYPHAGAKTVCRIGIKIDGEWVWKANGAGDSDIEAEKGALSDAMKRAAVCWGVGRYLYDFGNTWVAIKPQGKSFTIADEEKSKLSRIADIPFVQYWGPKYRQYIRDCETLDSLHITMEEMAALGLHENQRLVAAWNERKTELSVE